MPEYFYPCQPWSKFSVQLGTEFLSRGYEIATGALHTGCDMNALTGADTDLGKPVYAMTDGTVVHAGWDSWIGGIIVIWHAGPRVHSVYWHLKAGSTRVKTGDRVRGGRWIGAIGKGGRNQFLAHLHFEIRTAGLEVVKPAAWPTAMFQRRNIWGRVVSYDRAGALAFITKHYTDPIAFLEKNFALERLEDVS